jgi:hypothetical protein
MVITAGQYIGYEMVENRTSSEKAFVLLNLFLNAWGYQAISSSK